MSYEHKQTRPDSGVEQTAQSSHDGQSGSGLNQDNFWMEQALSEAQRASCDIPVGAVVVSNGKLIGSGCNERESSGDPTAHAEIVAIRKAATATGSWRLTGTTIYTTLEPCPMCAEAIIQSRVSRVVFGAYDRASGAAGSAFNLFIPGRIFPIPEVLGGMLEERCQKLLVDFFKNKPER